MDEALSYAMERKAFGKPIIEVHTGNTQTAQPASLCTLHIIAALLAWLTPTLVPRSVLQDCRYGHWD